MGLECAECGGVGEENKWLCSISSWKTSDVIWYSLSSVIRILSIGCKKNVGIYIGKKISNS